MPRARAGWRNRALTNSVELRRVLSRLNVALRQPGEGYSPKALGWHDTPEHRADVLALARVAASLSAAIVEAVEEHCEPPP